MTDAERMISAEIECHHLRGAINGMAARLERMNASRSPDDLRALAADLRDAAAWARGDAETVAATYRRDAA